MLASEVSGFTAVAPSKPPRAERNGSRTSGSREMCDLVPYRDNLSLNIVFKLPNLSFKKICESDVKIWENVHWAGGWGASCLEGAGGDSPQPP